MDWTYQLNLPSKRTTEKAYILITTPRSEIETIISTSTTTEIPVPSSTMFEPIPSVKTMPR